MASVAQQAARAGRQDDSVPVLTLKPPRQPFSATIQTSCNATFLHPGYDDGHNILLILPAVDSRGIHHETARIACAILADSRWDGFLSHEKGGPRLEQGPDDIIPHRQYYFCIEGDDQYPVVPSFDNFRCPRELPVSWSQPAAPNESSTAEDVGKRDITCRITGSMIANETAHIIPQAKGEWWQRNNMFTYTKNPARSFNTNCADNMICLRRDLSKMWNDHQFAVVPKAGKWVVHILQSSFTTELEETYHNLELRPLYPVSRYFLFCRFALAIIKQSPFLRQQTARRLVILTASGSPHVRRMSADDYQHLFTTSRGNSRSQSSKRHQRSAPGEVDDHDPTFPDSPSDTESELRDNEPERGRTRKRRFSYTKQNDRCSPDKTWPNSFRDSSPLRKRRHRCQNS